MLRKEKKNIYFSYRDCWNYARSLFRDDDNNIKNVISLCKVDPEKFWCDFDQRLLTFAHYRLICSSIYKHYVCNWPLPYLTNEVFFCGIKFKIQKGVFIPQSDTEILVKTVLELSKLWSKKELKILELGVGCGNIAITIAKNRPTWKITATDISARAIKVASANVTEQKLNNIRLLQSDLFAKLDSKREKFDLIISNPPYLSLDDYCHADELVRSQPYKSLFAAKKGLFFYWAIISRLKFFLNKKALVVFEISPAIENEVIKLIVRWFSSASIQVYLDNLGDVRVLTAYIS